jgi:hypothetical protein
VETGHADAAGGRDPCSEAGQRREQDNRPDRDHGQSIWQDERGRILRVTQVLETKALCIVLNRKPKQRVRTDREMPVRVRPQAI